MGANRSDNNGVTTVVLRAPAKAAREHRSRRRLAVAVAVCLLSAIPLAGQDTTTRLLTQARRGGGGADHTPADDARAPATPAPTEGTTPRVTSARVEFFQRPGLTNEPATSRSAGLPARSSTSAPSATGPTTHDPAPSSGNLEPSSGDLGPGANTPAPPSEAKQSDDAAGLDRDQENCPNLHKVAIGDATDAPSEVAELSARFRAFAAAELEKGNLVCADPMQLWRGDLVVQHLWVKDQSDGALITGLGDDSPIMRLDRSEFRTMQVNLGGPPDLNYIGAPLRRTTISGVPVVITTEGGLVMERPDQIGQIVLGGAWDRWIASGGPTGPMGMPMYKPSPVWELPDHEIEAMGIDLVPGATPPGAYQDFAGGYLFLPDVASELEAFQADADALEWHPRVVDAAVAATALHGSIITVGRRNYYVDRDGFRHWLEHPSEHSCARVSPGSTPQPVRGWVAAQFQPGRPHTCGGS